MGLDDDSTLSGSEFTDALAAATATAPAPQAPVADPTPAPSSPPPVEPVQPPPAQPDPAPPTPDPAPAQPPRAVEPPQQRQDDTLSILRKSARQMGLDIADESSAEEALLVALQNMHALKVAQQQMAAQKPVPEPAKADPVKKSDEFDPDAYFGEKWGVSWSPEYDQAITSGIVTQDPATGMYIAKPGFESVANPILPKMNESARAISQKWQGITRSNFYKDVYNVTKDPILREVDRIVQQRIAEIQSRTTSQNVVEKFESENASWIYTQDPVTKQQVPTQDGERLISAVQAMYAQGLEPSQAIQQALFITGLNNRTSKQAAPAPAPVAPAVPPPSQSPQQSFLEKARNANAYSPNATGPGVDPGLQINNEADLDTLFTRSLLLSR